MGIVLPVFCTAVTLASVISLYLVTRRRGAAASDAPAVSVLKPLCGADDALEQNLETFFRQRYPSHELVFGVVGDDAAAAVVRRLMARHPDVRARLVVHDGRRGLNPKVANVRGILAAGAHDLVVISDSNIAVGPDYLANMVAHMEEGVGVVTSLFAGVGEETLGAALENLHLCGPIAASVAASQVLSGHAVVVGKSVMFRRSTFEELGGMESLASILAEDYVMGRMFVEAGYEVRLCPDVIGNVVKQTSVTRFLDRQIRWALLRCRLKPLLYPFEPLISPLAVALLALALGAGGPWPLCWAAGLTLLRDAACWIRLRGAAGLASAAPLGLVKDALILAAWAVAPFRRSVSWRGTRLRVSAGTRLYLR
ncbi:MAG TPA: ceramide glucosyltransferase [Haliangiales bacterium]|nr:ceramide glucosyltransferase [Haliangiales bacterium]